jgi:hypothetical protein
MCKDVGCSDGCVQFKQDECKLVDGSYFRASFGSASSKSDAGSNSYSPAAYFERAEGIAFFALALLAFRLL